MQRNGLAAAHVIALGLLNAADSQIADYATENDYVVITKDEDFLRLRHPLQAKLQVIWIRISNCKNRELINQIVNNLPQAIKLLEQGESVVEIR